MNDRKKIRVAVMSYPMENRPGMGTGIHTRRLVEELLKDDRLELYLVHYDKVDDPLYKRAHEILMPSVKLPVATRFVRTMIFFWKFRNEKFDIVHWLQPRLYPFFWLVPARHIIVTAHDGGDVHQPGKFPLSRRVFNFNMIHFSKWIDAIIAVSEYGKNEIIEWYKVPTEKVFVIYSGGGERFGPVDRVIAKQKVLELYNIGDPYILDVARFHIQKNICGLIEGYVSARKKGVTHKLVVVGKDAGEYAAMRTLSDASGYGDDIIFITHAEGDDLNMLYAAADLFVSPTSHEGFGLPIVEAMSVGTPVITSNVTTLPEIAAGAAVLIDPYDPEEIGKQIQRTLSEESERSRMVKRGLERSKEFLWSKMGREVINLYTKVLEKDSVKSL